MKIIRVKNKNTFGFTTGEALTFFCIIYFLISCSQQAQRERPNPLFKTIEATGYNVPFDSITTPQAIAIDDNSLVKIPAGKPIIVSANANEFPAGQPSVTLAGIPTKCTPGKDSFQLPKTIVAIDNSFIGGIAEIVAAKDPYSKDQNPKNFSSFNKLQGLKHGTITCMIQDKRGNIWFGTGGGGASKYDGKSFTNYTDKEGLSNNVILTLMEDQNGNIWFGTFGGGVSKYDGRSFTHFTEKEGLSNNDVRSIFQDKKGNIWIGTNGGGVSRYDGRSFTHFSDKQGLPSNIILSILEDRKGNIWLGTMDGGVSRYDGNSFSNYSKKEGLSSNTVWSMLEDKNGDLWFATGGGGASHFDGRSFTSFSEKEGLSNNDILSVLEDNNGNIWFGTNGGGITKYNRASNGNINSGIFTHYKEAEGLTNNFILSVLKDNSGNLWFGTNGGGASRYDGKTFTFFTKKEGLNNNTVLSLLQDKKGNLWFGTYGGGVSKYNGKYFEHFSEKEGLSNNIVLSMLEDKKGNLWFGTNGGGISKYDGRSFTHFGIKNGLLNKNVWTIMEDKAGNLWCGTGGGGATKLSTSKDNRYSITNYTKKEGLSGNLVRTILEDKNGNIWFGTNGDGLTKYSPGKGGSGKSDFTHFREKEGLSNNIVWSILEDANGDLWFGTGGGGVTRFDGSLFTNFTQTEGLPNNVVLSLLQDKAGNIWFGTRFGLSKFSKEKQSVLSEKIRSKNVSEKDVFFRNYTYDDGFLGVGCSGNYILESNNGMIWMGTNEKLTVYHPEGERTETPAPNVQLTGIELFNENILWPKLSEKKDTTLILGNGVEVRDFRFDNLTKWYSLPENLSLAYNNNYLTFNFTGITQNQSKKIKYQYKLDGMDDNWSALTSSGDAPYGNLPHGSYTFKVKAMNSEGNWSNEFNYAFSIRPPWWKTWWFSLLVTVFIIACVVFYIKWRERSLMERQKILEQTVEERTAEVVHQKHIIEEKHKEITDSINYAERIQHSFLATKELLNEYLKDYFVFFHPKDVVSGDFYWAAKLSNGEFALITADSTGHGVPGAIMSILNISSLEKAVEQGLTGSSEILNQTRRTIIERLKKDGTAEGGKDGMDVSLICFDFPNQKFIYSAANNPIWVIREQVLIELSPDKMPVGKHDKDQTPFNQHEFKIQKNDLIYTLTDGFPDQFGGPKGKKFMSKQLKEFLINISPLPMNEQKQKLNETFKNWKGDLEQIDDVCLIGVRI